MEWKDITKEQPTDGTMVLVWDNYYGYVRLLVYNDYDHCWDTEDGDEFEMTLDETLANEPDKLRIEFWMETPDQPIKPK